MKTLLVTNDFPPKLGGIQSYLFGLLSTLEPSGVRVLAPDYPHSKEFDAAQPYEVVREPTSRLYPTPRLLDRICEMAAGTDIVQFGYAFQSWLIGPAMRRRTGVPYVVFVHGAEVLMPLRMPGASRLLMRGSLESAAGIFTVSAHTAAGVKRFTHGHPASAVIRPTVDLEKFRPSESLRHRVRERHGLGNHPMILCAGRLTARKGQDRLIDVLPGLNSRFGARLLLVGGGKMEDSLRRRARLRGVEKQVVFAGKVPDDELPAYYAAADVFAMPGRSRWFGAEEEGFGVVFVEAAASGLPIVVGDSGGAGEAVEDWVTGFLVDGSSSGGIQNALARLLSDRTLAKEMGLAARERARALHRPEVAGERYRRALESVAGNRAAG